LRKQVPANLRLFITDLAFSVIELGWGMGKSIGMLNGILYTPV